MLPQKLEKSEEEEEETEEKDQSEPSSSGLPSLSLMFEEMSATSSAANHVVAATAEERIEAVRSSLVFENLKLITKFNQTEEPMRRRKARLGIDPSRGIDTNVPDTPICADSKWSNPKITTSTVPFSPLSLMTFPNLSINTNDFLRSHYTPSPNYILPPVQNELMSEDELVRMKGPSRLIAFLVHIAMNERARRALRWTGQGLEFILINKEIVAKMWGNRKHNTKDMDYYKLSRAIREKYERKDKSKSGKLKKGSRTYSYVFTENSYDDLKNQTGESIEYIRKFAAEIGTKYRDNADITISTSPQAPSPQNSE